MGFFNIFRRKITQKENTPPPTYSNIQATDDGSGNLTLWLSDPESGKGEPFPPIDILLRHNVDIERIKQLLRDNGASAQDLQISPPLTDDVVEVLGLDEDHSFTIMSENSLRAKGLTHEVARKGAMFRLRAATANLKIEGGDGRYRVTYPDNMDLSASFMLISEDWLDMSDIRGTPVFAVGTRVSIHVCGSEDQASIAGMHDIAKAMYAESTEDPAASGPPLTPELLTLREGRIVPFIAETVQQI